MSRHELTLLPTHEIPTDPEIIVGWDPPLQTFFGYVKDLAIEDDGETDPILVWVGTTFQEISTVEQLAYLFAPWATIPFAISAALLTDARMDR